MDTLLCSLENGIVRLTLNRPEKMNSFNREMALALQKHLDDAANNEQVRCIVLTGNGRAFCAGQDLAEATDPQGPDMGTIVAEHYNPIITRIRTIEKPIVAAVNGVAAGAGANIALACDLVVAKESASFIQAFSKIGLIPDSGGTFFLPRLIGMQRAAALMMTGSKVSAQEAAQIGLIYQFYNDDIFEGKLARLTEEIAQMPTKALGLTKRLLNQSWQNNLSQQLEMEKQLQVEAGKSHDFEEGVNAFLDKRKPEFKGR